MKVFVHMCMSVCSGSGGGGLFLLFAHRANGQSRLISALSAQVGDRVFVGQTIKLLNLSVVIVFVRNCSPSSSPIVLTRKKSGC